MMLTSPTQNGTGPPGREVVCMLGWVRLNRGKKWSTFYVVIPWDRLDGSGKKKNWQFKFDRNGDRFESEAHAHRHLEYLRALIDDKAFSPLDWIEAVSRSTPCHIESKDTAQHCERRGGSPQMVQRGGNSQRRRSSLHGDEGSPQKGPKGEAKAEKINSHDGRR